MSAPLRLGVNIDHVATIPHARGGDHPDPVRAAQIVAVGGRDGSTSHLREAGSYPHLALPANARVS